MNKTLAAIIALAALPLIGCAGPEITEQDATMANAAALSRNYCVDARARGEAARMSAIAQMDPSQQGVALMAEAMRAQAEALGGKGDPCGSGMNAHEARARIAASQNEAATELVGSLVRGTLIGMGIVEGADLIKTAIKNSGDKTKVKIDGNDNKYDSAKTHINNEVVTKSFAEGASPSVTATPAATTASPSTSSTVHEAAELPEGEFTPTEPPDFPDGPIEIPGPEAAE